MEKNPRLSKYSTISPHIATQELSKLIIDTFIRNQKTLKSRPDAVFTKSCSINLMENSSYREELLKLGTSETQKAVQKDALTEYNEQQARDKIMGTVKEYSKIKNLAKEWFNIRREMATKGPQKNGRKNITLKTLESYFYPINNFIIPDFR